MTIREFSYSKLASSITWWLGYTSAVGRSYVLSEGAIKFPVSEYLEWLRVEDIELEYGHPKLFMKRFDLFFKNVTDEKNAFEFKFIKNGSTEKEPEKQRVFNDLMRLYLFLGDKQQGCFLICGSQFQFNNSFQNQRTKPKDSDGSSFIIPKIGHSTKSPTSSNGFYTEWFSFDRDNADKTIDLNSTNPDYSKIYKTFFDTYKVPYNKQTDDTLVMPSKIKTQLVFLSEDTKLDTEPTKVGIWKVTKST